MRLSLTRVEGVERKKVVDGLGEEGWELVTLVVLSGLNSRTFEYYFKRPKQE